MCGRGTVEHVEEGRSIGIPGTPHALCPYRPFIRISVDPGMREQPLALSSYGGPCPGRKRQEKWTDPPSDPMCRCAEEALLTDVAHRRGANDVRSPPKARDSRDNSGIARSSKLLQSNARASSQIITTVQTDASGIRRCHPCSPRAGTTTRNQASRRTPDGSIPRPASPVTHTTGSP